MATNVKIIVKSLVALAALATPFAYADSVTSNLSMDMTSELTRVGVSPASASVKGVIVTNTSASWAKGAPQNVKSAYYTLQVTSGAVSSVNHGLKVDYNPIRIPAVEVSACAGDGINCSALEVTGQGAGEASFSLDGNSYVLTTLGPPCESGVTCSFYLNSWHLMNMVREMNGSLPIGFPAVAAVIDTPNSILLMDMQRSAIWFTVPKGVLPTSGSIGDLLDVSYDGAGALTLNFASSRVLLDFARDRALIATADELLVSEAAIVGIAAGGFSSSVTIPRVEGVTAKILFLNSTTAVWSTHYLSAPSVFQVGQIALREAQQPLIAAGPGALLSQGFVGLSESSGQGQKWTFANGNLSSSQSAFAIQGPASLYRVVRGDIWKADETSARLVDLGTGSFKPTSIDNSDVRAMVSGHSAIRRQVGTNCRYAHLVQHLDSSAAFKDSGLVMSCNSYAGITESGGGVAIYGQSGAVVQAGFLLK